MYNDMTQGEKMEYTLLKNRFNGDAEAMKQWRQSIGAVGGKKSRNGGFASDKIGPDGLTGKERARRAGSLGGKARAR